MHLGRFHAAIQDLANYYAHIEIDRYLSAALSHIQTYNSNKDVAQLNAFRDVLHDLAKKAEDMPSSFLLPSVIALHEDLHVEEFIGEKLATRIRSAMSTPGMIAEEVIAEINTLQRQTTEVVTQINEIASRLRARRVELVILNEADAEFGIAFPPELVGTTAKDLLFEVTRLNRLFMAMNELLGRGTESPKVRTIAASWWQFFFELDAAQVALWTVALERIIQLVKSGYEIRKLKQDLEGKKEWIPANFIPELDERMLNLYKEGVSSLAVELRRICEYKGDDARANELEVLLKQELLHMVRRINGGAVLEIRLGIPGAPEEKEEEVEAGSPEAIARDEQLVKISEAYQLNEKLASLSHTTVELEIREDLLLEAPSPEEMQEPGAKG